MGTLPPMEPDRQASLPPFAGLALTGLFAPLIVSWGLGTRGAILDLLATPAAALAGLPAGFGVLGVAALATLTLVGTRSRRAALAVRALGAVGGLALLASASAGSRPLPWIAAAALAIEALGRRSRRPEAAWRVPAPIGLWLPTILWAAAARARPFGEGLLGTEDGVAALVAASPWIAEAALLATIGGVGVLLHRARPARVPELLAGAGAGWLLVSTFGNDQAVVSAITLGAVAGAWAPRVAKGDLVEQLTPLLLVCLLAGLRLGVVERWRCDALQDEPLAKVLLPANDVRGLALAPGNLPWIVALVEDGAALQRFTITGAASPSVPLDPPGGTLITPVRAGDPVVRAVSGADGLTLEWWDPSRMQITARRSTPSDCSPRSGLLVGDDVVVRCAEGSIRLGVSGEPTADPRIWTERLAGAALTVRPGPLARVTLIDDDDGAVASARLGPWSTSAVTAPGRFVVPRGPAGHVELRGLPEVIPSLYTAPTDRAQRAAEMLATVRDSVRVGVWPTAAAYSVKQKAVYVWSDVDPFVTLVDHEVSWHQGAAAIGAPPRQVVVDPGSGTLYGANRCGIFAVRVASTFPWE